MSTSPTPRPTEGRRFKLPAALIFLILSVASLALGFLSSEPKLETSGRIFGLIFGALCLLFAVFGLVGRVKN